ncbi:MAG TPA: hypothetical protein VI547_03990 [Anaerolineales bacterium]|nr:hypothetical protein [Anaerolineales bacterium]
MPQLVMLIMDDPSKSDDVAAAWIEVGVTGASSIDTYGTGHLWPGETRDDLPLIPSLADLIQGRHEQNRLLFSLVRDDFDVERLVAATETILGPLNDPDTGIMFTLPLGQVWGLHFLKDVK